MAFAVIALALAMKAFVPAGFMVVAETRVLAVQLCQETVTPLASAGEHVLGIAIPINRDSAPGHGPDHGKGDGVCQFSTLSFASLGGADPIQLALALLVILATGFVAITAQVSANTIHLRPPLRGPPALA